MTANRRNGKALGWAALLAAVAASALWLAGRPAGAGDAPPKGTAGELDAVPADGVAVVSIRFADVWDNPVFKSARERLAKLDRPFEDDFTKEVGVAPETVERITGVTQSVEGPPAWAAFVTTIKPYDAGKVAAALAPDGKEETVNGHKVQVGAAGAAVGFLTDRTYVRGPADEVRRILKGNEGGKEGPLAAALREAAGKHLLVAALDVEALAKAAPPETRSAEEAALKPLLKAKTALLTVDLADEVKADVRMTFEGESDARHGEEAVNDGLDLARAALVARMQEMQANRDLAHVVGLMKDVQAGLRAVKVERNGSSVEVAASVKIDPEKTGVTLLDGIQKVREAAARMQSVNNLKQIVLAMHGYHDAYGHFPAQAVYDKDGKPLLSWRVTILPFVEQEALYKEFHLDEPWDSEHNKKLLDKMPKVFASPGQSEESLKKHETPYQGFAGKGAFFDGKQGVKVSDVTDGLSNTIMLVETAKTVPWSKPDDIPFDEGKLLPKVGGLFDRIFSAAMCDGSVRSLPMTLKEETLRALITRDGGEVINESDK